MFYQGTQLPPPNNRDSPDYCVPVSPPRIKLRDGRFLAYREKGVPKDQAKHSIIIELIDELGIYILQYPNPKRSLKSEALDIEELADQLQIGSKFYVIDVSMGSYATWSCLNYIPNRLAGVTMIAPVINYQWPSFPEEKSPAFFNKGDIYILETIPGLPMLTKDLLREKVSFDTLRGDSMVAFDNWEFDPLKLSNPFPQNRSSAHIWQGYEDKVVPSQIQRLVTQKLPWTQKLHIDQDQKYLYLDLP
ncbi:hypothetical protein GLYMA_11G183900v4 [Glycine max]|uniref:AB hydrolase-1 domain-containing protein n=1 Tax=Glycine max TaxID=3847 RepID=K7LQ68_SOYBN|nr:hypothetical protein GYH30_031112 [Glycine max]KRH30441.1 hypothetical protein GLYMA_11G183900v4 [Glycine max]